MTITIECCYANYSKGSHLQDSSVHRNFQRERKRLPRNLTGTYTVNSDCSATALMTTRETSAFVIVNRGQKIFSMGQIPFSA
jgi:hypothetical protein